MLSIVPTAVPSPTAVPTPDVKAVAPINNDPPPPKAVPANVKTPPTAKSEPESVGTIEFNEPVPVVTTVNVGIVGDSPAAVAVYVGVTVLEPATKS